MLGLILALNWFFQTAKPFATDLPTKYAQVSPAADAVVATVDGVEIKAKDVEDLLWQWRGADAVRELIEYQLVKAEADKRAVSVTPAEVDAKLTESLTGFSQQNPGKDVDDLLLQQGFTKSRIYLRLTRQLLLQKMAEKDFDPKNFVKVSAITIKPDAGKTLEQAIAEGDADYKKLQGGAKWEAVLATSTSDANVVQSGGLLGWRPMRIFPESTVKEFGTLKSGAFTKPVQTTAGVQIFRIESKGSELRSEAVNDLKGEYLAGAMPALEKQIRDKAKVTPYPPVKHN